MWLPWAFHSSSGLQCLIVIRGKVVENQGARVNCWDQPLRFAWVSIISNFNASVQGYSGVLMVFQFSAN